MYCVVLADLVVIEDLLNMQNVAETKKDDYVMGVIIVVGVETLNY